MIPLIILMMVVLGFITKARREELVSGGDGLAQENYQTVIKNIQSFTLFEQLVNSNGKLTLLLTIPEHSTEDEIIETMISETTMFERTLQVMLDIYALRIFSDNPLVPERWPIFMNSSRTNLAALERWEFGYTADYLGNLGSQKYESVCTTRRVLKNHQEIGYIQIAMKTSDFFPFLFKTINSYNNDYVFREVPNSKTGMIDLLPVTNSLIEQTQRPLPKNLYDDFYQAIYEHGNSAAQMSGKVILRHKNDVRYANWVRIPDMDIIMLHTVSQEGLHRELIFLWLCILLGLAIIIFVMHFFVRHLTSRLMGRVFHLIDGMRQVQDGDFSASIPVTGNDEVAQTQRTFNKMVEQLRTQIEQIKREQRLVADTEIKAMQNQINAHFLYNALETIRMQAVIAGAVKIEESIGALGKLMHYCLRWRIYEVTLWQEIDYIRSYIYFLNIRNDYEISLEIEIPEKYRNLAIAKMCLQPLVENAFFYAVEPFGKDAVIRVYTEECLQSGRIHLCVQDFGPGIPQEKFDSITQYLSDDSFEQDFAGKIGFKNIQQRLTAFYGKDFRIIIESGSGNGTLVKIPVSLRYKDERQGELE